MAAIDLPRIIKGMALRRRVILFPTFDFPPTTEADLLRIYVQVPRMWAVEARNRLMPAYRFEAWHQSPTPGADGLTLDDLPGLQEELNGIDERMNRLVITLTPEMRAWAIKAEAYHRRRFAGAAKTAAGVDLSTILTFGGVETTVEAVLQRNVSLVRNVSDDIRRSIGDAVFRSFQNREPRAKLAQAINEATQLGKRRSMVIARDQTTKLAAALDRERQEEIGITQFVWRHSGKVHYRPHHLARDGKVYSWKRNNLGGDLPGVAINCGCKAQAYVGELMSEAQAPEALPPERIAERPEATPLQPVRTASTPFEPLGEPGRQPASLGRLGQAELPQTQEPFAFVAPPPLPPTRGPVAGIRDLFPTGSTTGGKAERKEVFEKMGLRSIGNESSAVQNYAASGYATVNDALDALRKGLTANTYESVKRLTSELDAAIASSTPLKVDSLVWRGISRKREHVAGDAVDDAGFWSTSINPNVALSFASYRSGTVYRIHIPAGQKTFLVRRGGRGEDAALDDEAEILLPRGSRFVVTSVERVDRGHGDIYTVNHLALAP